MTPNERIAAVGDALKKVSPPSLRRVNGFGNIAGGRYYDPAMAPLFFIAVVPTALFIPLSRGVLYLVGEGPPDIYTFYGQIPWEVFERVYPNGFAKIKQGSGLEAIVSFVIAILAFVLMVAVFTTFHQLFRR